MHSSTIRNYRCGISQGTLYRTVNENARRKGQACVVRSVCSDVRNLLGNGCDTANTRINMPISIRDAGASFSSTCAEALCFCDLKS